MLEADTPCLLMYRSGNSEKVTGAGRQKSLTHISILQRWPLNCLFFCSRTHPVTHCAEAASVLELAMLPADFKKQVRKKRVVVIMAKLGIPLAAYSCTFV